MIKDYFALSLRDISRRKLRSWLTMLGIFIGIAAVVALISLGQGMQQAINEQFEKIGKDRIIVTAGGVEMGPFGAALTAEKLRDKDVEVVRKASGIKFAQGIISDTARVDFRDETEYVDIFGIPNDGESIKEIEAMKLFEVGSGRELQSSDKYSAVVAYNVAYDLFNRDIKVRDKIKIDGKEFDVVGIQKKIGTGVHDVIIRIPKDTAKDIFNCGDEYSMITSIIKEGQDVEVVKERIERDLRKSRNVKENEEDFSVQTSAQMIQTLNMIIGIVQIVLIGIAAISLVVGGIGIMNTMYTSVLERTREIGIMKAVGARNSQIMLLFLIESGMLGLIGGVIGVFIGLSMSKSAELIASTMGVITLKAFVSPTLVITGLLFSFFVGAVSGFFPAREASSMQPVEAMRR